MNTHLDNATLLEAYYLEETGLGETGKHLAACIDCRRRLDEVISLATSQSPEPVPESFWTRQRESIAEKIELRQAGVPLVRRTFQVAAAAVLVAILGALLLVQPAAVVSQPVAATASVAPPVAEELTVPSDPWESDQLKEFSSIVEWESVVEQQRADGGQS